MTALSKEQQKDSRAQPAPIVLRMQEFKGGQAVLWRRVASAGRANVNMLKAAGDKHEGSVAQGQRPDCGIGLRLCVMVELGFRRGCSPTNTRVFQIGRRAKIGDGR